MGWRNWFRRQDVRVPTASPLTPSRPAEAARTVEALDPLAPPEAPKTCAACGRPVESGLLACPACGGGRFSVPGRSRERELDLAALLAIPASVSSWDSRDRGEATEAVAFGAGTNILKFPAGFERQYDRHLALASELKRTGVYPVLNVFALKGIAPQASCPRLLVVTGSVEESRKLSKVFYTREAEEFVRGECANDWNAISPASSLSNVPDPGCSVDLKPFNALVEEIRAGYYDVETEF